MRLFSFLMIGMLPFFLVAQQKLSLEDAYLQAEKNYPLGKQIDVLEKKALTEVDIIEKGKLPKLNFDAQATYQSDVVQFPPELPGVNIKSPNKDQYRATIEANQLIYDGGSIDANTRLRKAELQTEQQQVRVDLYGLKKMVNQYFFTALLLQEQKKIMISKKELLNERLKEINSGVKYGAVLKVSEQLIQAEILKIDQQIAQIDYDLKKAFEKLSLLISENINSDTILENPSSDFITGIDNKRPELKLFDLRENQLEASKDVISKSRFPKISGFAQAGYGNPGLNMLDNSFKDFYMVGIKLSWNVFDWGVSDRKKEVADYSKQIISNQRETFLLNNEIEQKDALNDIDKFEDLLKNDSEIIGLREEVLKTATSQLKFGTITPSEYIIELNNLYEARINYQLHKIQMELSVADYNVIVGNTNQN